MTKRRPGRPPRNMPVPHPFKHDEWVEVGAYDKTWPMVIRYAELVRGGKSRRDSLNIVAAEFDVEEQRIIDWLSRARKRGPIGPFEDYPDDFE